MGEQRTISASMGPDATLRLVMTDGKGGRRQCGGCTLCCKLLPMSRAHYPRERVSRAVGEMIAQGMAQPRDFAGMVDHFDKPAGKPCPHQRHSKGCAIYSRRPFSCRMWSCRWLTGDDTAELSRPDRSRYVIDLVPDFVTITNEETGQRTNVEIVQIWCDPKEPEAWRDPVLLAFIERRAEQGIAALIRFDNKRAIGVFAPPISNDGKWHEVHHGHLTPEHLGDTLVEGLASARKIRGG